MTRLARKTLIESLIDVAREAGQIIRKHEAKGAAHTLKADSSPVTQADQDAETHILRRLAELAPQVPVVSEEATAGGHVPETGERFFLVDPLDGTKEFLKGNGEYTVNIALIVAGNPALGVVFAPAKGRLFAAIGEGDAWEYNADGAPLRRLHAKTLDKAGVTALISRSHRDRQDAPSHVGPYPVREARASGSSLKFCLIAAGEGDVYPREGPTMEWDTAAGHAVLAASGGTVTLADGVTPLTYGKRDMAYANPPFIAWGQRD